MYAYAVFYTLRNVIIAVPSLALRVPLLTDYETLV